MGMRERYHRDPDIVGDLLMPWERFSEGTAGEPQLTELDSEVKPILNRRGEVIAVVGYRKSQLGFDPRRAR